MRKNIILTGGEIRSMNFEEVLEQFKAMIHKTANDTLNRIIYNRPEKEDLVQELKLQCWEAFERYDEKHAFSTYLFYRLQLGVNKYTMGNYAKKRQHNGMSSLDAELSEDGDSSLEAMLGEECDEMLSIEFRDFLKRVEQMLSPDEMMMLYSLMNLKELTVADLAREWGVSRVTANNRMRKFKVRMAGIMRGTGFITC